MRMRPTQWLFVLSGQLLLSSALFLCSAHAFAQGAASVSIAADNQSFDTTGKTKFTGNVKVAYGNYRISSDWATLESNGDSGPSLATFYNRPTAHRIIANGQDDLRADLIKLFLNENRFQAEGNVDSYVTTVAQAPVSILSDVQEFNNVSKMVEARGNVRVDYDKTKISSPKALLWIDEGGKAKRVLFSGGTRAIQDSTDMTSEKLTIIASNGNMLAETNVKTDMTSKPAEPGDPTKVRIESDFQQYDKVSGMMLASGNVKINYGDYRAFGPKATFKFNNGQVNTIIISGRGKIITSTRQVLADKIVITTNPKHFDALGNVKSKFITESNSASGATTLAPAAASAVKPTPAMKKAAVKSFNKAAQKSAQKAAQKEAEKPSATSQQQPSDEYLQ